MQDRLGKILGYGVPIVTGAFLLFQVQPLMARYLLPWFGGGASVWTACMLFFQAALLGGYLYAHWAMAKLDSRRLAVFHAGLLAVSLFFLPIGVPAGWEPHGTQPPVLYALLLLGITVGLPYMLLASTSPILQSVYARQYAGASPYHYFAISNAASLLGLLSYPFVIEPSLGLRTQAVVWSSVYGVYAVAIAVTLWRARGLAPAPATAEDSEPPSGVQKVLWVLLPCCASLVLLTSTSFLTHDLPPIPFLWVLPLALYLASFVFCFDQRRWYKPSLFSWLMLLGLGALAVMHMRSDLAFALRVSLPLVCAGVFVASMYFHGETAARKPAAPHLTSFYLSIAAGGAAGGVLAAVVAPLTLPGTSDLFVAVALAAAVTLGLEYRRSVWRDIFAVGCTILCVAVAASAVKPPAELRAMQRNFYGTLRVMERRLDNPSRLQRVLFHGSIIHGTQYLEPADTRLRPTAYFAEGSGIHSAIERTHHSGQRVGIIGLGAGTLAAWGRPGDVYRFYEINPQVLDVAQTWFTYLKDTKARCEFVMGDARLALAHEAPQQYDILAVDAFSGDSVPIHLLTREALELYLRHIRAGGILALHISNHYLDLEPVAAASAPALGLEGCILGTGKNPAKLREASVWVVMGREKPAVCAAGKPLQASQSVPVWTDNYSSVWRLLR